MTASNPDHRRPLFFAILAALVGLLLVWQASASSSATYDETTYLNAASRWWRDGESVGITRMGSPNVFWKLQTAPVFWTLDRLGRGELIDQQPERQAELLPMVRIGASWIWVVGLAFTAWWARRLNGAWAMAFAAWLYALSPNLIAHGSLVTMEAPLVVATTAQFWAFWEFLTTRRRHWFWASGALGGLAFACKFTAIVYPPILALVWWLHDSSRGERVVDRFRRGLQIGAAMAGYLVIALASDFALTGFALLPLSPRVGGDHPSVSDWFGPLRAVAGQIYETPIPQDWVGLATQLRHQASGGPGYLLGERRMEGWRHYYLIAMLVKTPPMFWLLAFWRLRHQGVSACLTKSHDRMLLMSALIFFALASMGSSRNYGVRYILPMAPLAVVWISGLISRGQLGGTPVVSRVVLGIGLLGNAVAVASVHPDPLTYFNVFAGGRHGGRYVLADSNLDWGQGLRSLVRLQRAKPEFRDLTFYSFGEVEPATYGVAGVSYVVDAINGRPTPPGPDSATTPFLAVSSSLQHGPWGPADLFEALQGVEPIAFTDDATIAIYRTVDVKPVAGR